MPWSVTIMVVAIILIVTIGRISKERYRAMGRMEAQPINTAETMAAREEVKKLKERVQVLERVITDNRSSVDLNEEIERLRDR